MKTSRHIVMIAVLLLALSLLAENASHIRTAQTLRTILCVSFLFWLIFLVMSNQAHQENEALHKQCERLLVSQKRKLDESIELINLSRARYQQPLLIPTVHVHIFQKAESLIQASQEVSLRMSSVFTRRHILNMAHNMLTKQDASLHELYINEIQREYDHMPQRILLRLIRLRKEIPFYDARHLLPELKKVYAILKERHHPERLQEKYGEDWKLSFVNEVEKLYSHIEEQLYVYKKPHLRRLV